MVTKKLTQAEMVLLSLYRVSGGAEKKVAYEELVLQAWKDFPSEFSLRNHPEHPDSSDIHKRLYQSLNPVGYTMPLGNKNFRITSEGIVRAKQLLAAGEGEPPNATASSTRLSRSEQTLFQHAIRSDAFQVWREGNVDRLIDYDVKSFFQFSTATSKSERQRRVRATIDALAKAAASEVPEADQLLELARYLAGAFPALLEEERKQ